MLANFCHYDEAEEEKRAEIEKLAKVKKVEEKPEVKKEEEEEEKGLEDDDLLNKDLAALERKHEKMKQLCMIEGKDTKL